MIQAGQNICAPVGERITPRARAHPFSHRYEMNLVRNNVLWESHVQSGSSAGTSFCAARCALVAVRAALAAPARGL